MILENRNDELREASGKVAYSDPLTTFLYLLMRNELAAGKVEVLVNESIESEEECAFTNGWLARYANNLAEMIRNSKANHLQTALEKAFSTSEEEKKEAEREEQREEIKKTIEMVEKDGMTPCELSDLEQKLIQIAGVGKLTEQAKQNTETETDEIAESADDAKDTVQELVDQGHMTQEDADVLKEDIDDVVKEEEKPVVKMPVEEAEEIVKETKDEDKITAGEAKDMVNTAAEESKVFFDKLNKDISSAGVDLVDPIETQKKEQEEDDKEHEEEDRKAEKGFWKHWSENPEEIRKANPDMSDEEYDSVMKAIKNDVDNYEKKWKTTNEELQKMEKETPDED